MANLPHFIYNEELRNGEWFFNGKEPCSCNFGKNHWYIKSVNRSSKEQADANPRLLDKASCSRDGEEGDVRQETF